MESLHKKLDGQRRAVLAACEALGPFATMRLFKVRDYVSFAKWLKETTGDENYGLNARARAADGETLGDQLVAAFLLKVAALTEENKRLRETVNHLRWELGIEGEREQTQAIAILEACKA